MSAPPSKTPPRFVPTLTDVVAVDAVQAPVQAVEPPAPLAHPVSELPLTDEATPWASEGMLAPRRGVVALPASLPPLPQDLEPQRPMVTEQAAPEEIPTPAMQPVLSDYQPPSAPSVEMQLAQESRLAEMADVTDAADVAGAADVAAAGDVAPVGEVVPADLVVPVVQAVVAEAAAAPTPAAPTMESIWDSHAQQVTEEYLVHRLMQRVDLVLDQRLRDAIATVVQQQTRSIVVRLREEVESVVRQAVYEAVADELAFRATAARGDSGQGGR
ncbi:MULTISPECIES: hypothetical protein [Delftia]|uniref:hypothetical protein n=1 Tax=Delftia TaxID=80865 RepID=UPI0002D7FB73|nr:MULTISPECIES: hypothetical protein [Delftia]MCP4018128.1 hypothetical protein [Delftia sp.]MBN9325260.1 hypothetical protein [Delftia acidovorans]MCP4532766.1 hypothetical protein [Delftia sp.]OLE09045.1 MAG: hypothetical protein AUG53_03465 [Delftia sp. 13_1_20CM_4_67_18]QPS74536.1 hypothetical protein I6G48_28670 [Delftia acidovorans]